MFLFDVLDRVQNPHFLSTNCLARSAVTGVESILAATQQALWLLKVQISPPLHKLKNRKCKSLDIG